MKKTGEFWLNCLDDDVREKWLNNYDPNFIIFRDLMELKEYLEREMDYIEFINDAFSWGLSPEADNSGSKYWNKIYLTDVNKLIQHQRNRKLKTIGII